jgi:hypothetical protein
MQDTYIISETPKTVGYLDFGRDSLKVYLTNKPSKWQRFWARFLFGVKWINL